MRNSNRYPTYPTGERRSLLVALFGDRATPFWAGMSTAFVLVLLLELIGWAHAAGVSAGQRTTTPTIDESLRLIEPCLHPCALTHLQINV